MKEIRSKKKLYKIKVMNFVPYSGTIKVYWIWAYSEEQARKLISKRFNQENHFDCRTNFVDMRVEEIKK